MPVTGDAGALLILVRSRSPGVGVRGRGPGSGVGVGVRSRVPVLTWQSRGPPGVTQAGGVAKGRGDGRGLWRKGRGASTWYRPPPPHTVPSPCVPGCRDLSQRGELALDMAGQRGGLPLLLLLSLAVPDLTLGKG